MGSREGREDVIAERVAVSAKKRDQQQHILVDSCRDNKILRYEELVVHRFKCYRCLYDPADSIRRGLVDRNVHDRHVERVFKCTDQ